MALPFPGVVCLSSTGAKIHTCTTETSWSQASSSILCLCFKLFITFTASVTERMVSSIFWRSLWYSSCLFSKMKPKWFNCNIVSGGLILSALFDFVCAPASCCCRRRKLRWPEETLGENWTNEWARTKSYPQEKTEGSSSRVMGWIFCSLSKCCSLNPGHFPALICGNQVVEGKLGQAKLEESGLRWLPPYIKGEVRGRIHAGRSMLEAEVELGERP